METPEPVDLSFVEPDGFKKADENLKYGYIGEYKEPVESWERNAEKINDSLWYVNPKLVREALTSQKQKLIEEVLSFIDETDPSTGRSTSKAYWGNVLREKIRRHYK